MKYLKTFEQKELDYEVGHYVLLTEDISILGLKKNILDKLNQYLKTTIGKIYHIRDHYNSNEIQIEVSYNNIPDDLKLFFYETGYGEMVFIFKENQIQISPSKIDLKLYLKAKKYNII